MTLLRFLQNLGALMKPKALDCCRNYSFEVACRGVADCRKLRCSQQSRAFGFILLLSLFIVSAPPVNAEVVRIADGKLQVGLDAATGSLRELIQLPDGYNQVAGSHGAFGLWQISVGNGETTQELTAGHAGPPKIERLSGGQVGLRLVWDKVAAGGLEPLRVEVVVRLGQQGAPLSRWELSVTKPKNVRLKQVRFPRVASLRERTNEVLAVPKVLGILSRDPRKLLQGKGNKGLRLAWGYPFPLVLQCLAFYQQDGPGFYAACDDTEGFRKEFAAWGDGKGQVHFEILHEPEQAAAEMAEFRLPFAVLLGAFRGDWMTAAQMYRESPTARTFAERGRLRRALTPAWLSKTGLWLWNRGRSQQVLGPATVMRKHLQAPVSILWHWWHNCPYDAGFPEYLPPREGADAFRAALAAAERQDVRAILYMNQRLWGTQTRSWTNECAEVHAVKGKDGKVRTEVYNVFMKAPCAPMCIGTRFWRDKYAGIAQEVLCDLKPAGIYMDQVGVMASCHDPSHGHIVGPGRYWTDGLAMLAAEIRDRSSSRGPVALGGEYCGEPWIGSIDMTLGLNVSADRIGMGPDWEIIPFYHAVYHDSAVVFGSMAGLAHPPYDEKWPQELAPPGRLALLDRKFAKQFYLDHARTFAWGMQPMLVNFLPSQLKDRAEEMDFVTRMVRTRMRSLKYLLHGTWLRPPPLDVPQQEIDVAKVGTYTPLKESKRTYPVALAGAWRAPDGDVGIALASISDEKLSLRLPINASEYGLKDGCSIYRTDESGRHRLGRFDAREPAVRLELPPRAVCMIEFCAKQ